MNNLPVLNNQTPTTLPNKKESSVSIIRILLVVIIFIIGGVFGALIFMFFSNNNSANSTLSVTPTPTPTATIIPTTNLVTPTVNNSIKTYTSSNYKFSFEYPISYGEVQTEVSDFQCSSGLPSIIENVRWLDSKLTMQLGGCGTVFGGTKISSTNAIGKDGNTYSIDSYDMNGGRDYMVQVQKIGTRSTVLELRFNSRGEGDSYISENMVQSYVQQMIELVKTITFDSTYDPKA